MPQITGNVTVTADENRLSVVPAFANFLQVSSVGNDVQLEFMFVDLSDLAGQIDKAKKEEGSKDFSCSARTVSKMIMPAASFVQLKDHLAHMFENLEAQFNEQQLTKKPPKRVGNNMATSAVRRRVSVGLPNNSFAWRPLAVTFFIDDSVNLYSKMKVVSRSEQRPLQGRQSPLTLVSKSGSTVPPRQGIYIDVDE